MPTKQELKIELGDRVRCRVSGFTGIATQRVENLNGCIQYTVRPPVDKDGKFAEAYSLDVENLEVIKAGAAKVKSRPGGGTNTVPAKQIR